MTHNAKHYLQWTRGDFGVDPSDPWDPNDLTGGTGSLLATAVRTAIQKSDKIYFKVDGFDITEWFMRYLQAGSSFPPGSITAWELYQLVFEKAYAARHPSMTFVSGATARNYDDLKQYAITTLEAAARQEKAAHPNWQTMRLPPEAIRSLQGLFGYNDSQIDAL
jgi:hypothetical protein